jgi:pimeloyl-ACP methyl ester carboxylesterase
MSQKPVLLIHGLWQGAVSMLPLAISLQHRGWTARRFSYASVSQPWPTQVARLKRQLEQADPIYEQIVAHSLGGLLALSALSELGHTHNIKQLLLLGTPVQGSAVAARMLTNPLLRRLLGHSGSILAAGVSELVPLVAKHCQLVMFAGCRPLGLGTILTDLGLDHDGTVAVDETRHTAMHKHLTLSVGHTGLLVSRSVLERVDRQLNQLSNKNIPLKS